MPNKKDLFFVILQVIITLLLLHNLLKIGIYSSHDSEVHIARLAQFNQAMKEGQFPPRWLASWNFGYGYPTFIYSYSLPYYLGTLIKNFGLNYEQIFKILMYLSLFLSSLTFYYFAKKTVNPWAAFIGAVFYVSAPYRFADIYERGALGESLTFVLIPLLFLSPHIIAKYPTRGFLITTLSIFAFLTTHALTFLIFIVPATVYSYFVLSFKKMFFQILLPALVFGFSLATFQWLPMIFEQKYVDLDKTYFNIYEGNFITAFQLLRIPHEGINIGTGVQLGSAQILIILISLAYILILFLTKKKQNLLIVLFLITTIIASYLTTDLSKEIWKNFRPLQTLLFSWRFLTYTTFATAVLASFLFSNLDKKILKIIIFPLAIFLAVFPSRHYLKGSTWHTFPEQFYATYPDRLKLDNYYLPKGTNKNLDELSLEPLSIIQGQGSVKLISKVSNQIQAEAYLSSDSKVQFHTIYFPGWQLYVDGQKSEIIKDYPNMEGIIVAKVQSGVREIDLKFEETLLRKMANYTTLISFLVLSLIIIFKKIKRVF